MKIKNVWLLMNMLCVCVWQEIKLRERHTRSRVQRCTGCSKTEKGGGGVGDGGERPNRWGGGGEREKERESERRSHKSQNLSVKWENSDLVSDSRNPLYRNKKREKYLHSTHSAREQSTHARKEHTHVYIIYTRLHANTGELIVHFPRIGR